MGMTIYRAKLKAKLLIVRKRFLDRRAICELCGKADASDLHEAWVSRGQAQGNDELMECILESEYNVVLLCNTCNVNRAESGWAQAYLRSKLMYQYGHNAIHTWVSSLPFKNESIRDQFVLEVRRVAEDIARSKEDLTAEQAEPFKKTTRKPTK